MTTITLESPEIVEGDSSVNFLDFIVSLSEPASADITLPYSVQAGTALANQDLTPTINTLRIPAGESFGTIRVRVFNETLVEDDESIVLEVFKPANADLSNGQQSLRTVGWVLDNDGDTDLSLYASSPRITEDFDGVPPVRFDLALSRPAPTDLTLEYEIGGSAEPGRDAVVATSGEVTIEAGRRTASIDVEVLDDALLESFETLDLSVALPSAIGGFAGGQLTIVDDEPTEPVLSVRGQRVQEQDSSVAFVDFIVELSEVAEQNVSVDWRTLAGTAVVPGDFSPASGTLTIRAGDRLGTIRVRAANDANPEPDRSIVVELSSPQNAVLEGGATIVQEVGFIVDNDGFANPVALHASDVTIREGESGARTATIDLDLSRPAPTGLSIGYDLVGDTATEGEDFAATGDTIVFQRGASQATIEVEILGDAEAEMPETFDIVFDAPPTLASAPDARVTILDNDGPRLVSAEEARAIAYLYEAGLDRDGAIDLPGLNFWIDQFEAGRDLETIAQDFLDSPEFDGILEREGFDTLDDASDNELVRLLYRNVLNREGEQAGVDFWTEVVGRDNYSRAELLRDFSVSPENVEASPDVLQLAEVGEGSWAFLG